jgi:hypothetical protein
MTLGNGEGMAARNAEINLGELHAAIDIDEGSAYIDAPEEYDSDDFRVMLDLAEVLGFAPLDPDDHDADLLDGNRIRIWLEPHHDHD